MRLFSPCPLPPPIPPSTNRPLPTNSAGASGVSIAGQQLSLHATSPSPNVFATARRDEKCDFCVKTLGSKAAVNTTKHENWAEEIKKANDGKGKFFRLFHNSRGQSLLLCRLCSAFLYLHLTRLRHLNRTCANRFILGVDLIIDYIGAPYFQQNLDVLNLDGRVVQLGVMGGVSLEGLNVNISAFLMKRARFQGSTLRSRKEEYQCKLRDLFEEKVCVFCFLFLFVFMFVGRGGMGWDGMGWGAEGAGWEGRERGGAERSVCAWWEGKGKECRAGGTEEGNSVMPDA